MTNTETLAGFFEDGLIVFTDPDFDSAIIGATTDGRVVYDYDKMVENLMESDRMTQDDAADYISYNTIRSIPYMGQKAPVIMYSLEGYK